MFVSGKILYIKSNTVVPLLRDHPVVHTKVVFEEGWSFIRERKQCKPKHVSSGIVVLNVRLKCEVVFDQDGLSRGGLLLYGIILTMLD